MTVQAVQLVSPEDVVRWPYDSDDGNSFATTWFIGGHHTESGATAYAGETGHTIHRTEIVNPGGVINAHFHAEDQFQLVVSGSGRLGDTPVVPGSFHYVDAYTPYGPIEAGSDGLGFFGIRVNPNHLTEYRVDWNHATGYTRPEINHTVDLDVPEDTVIVEPHADGLAVFRRVFAAGESVELEAPEETGGRVGVVLSGTLETGGKSYPQWSCVSVPAGETASGEAGEDGLDILLMQFPPRPARIIRKQTFFHDAVTHGTRRKRVAAVPVSNPPPPRLEFRL